MRDLAHYTGLEAITTSPFPLYASLEIVQDIVSVTTRFEHATRFFGRLFNVRPEIGLVVLSAADWGRYAALPVFGVTHYDYARGTIVTAVQPSSFWQSSLNLVERAAPQMLPEIRAVYGRPDEAIDLLPHIHLWLAHDIGHAFHLHSSYWFPRRWLMEYFADLCSYVYTATQEPDSLPYLETFPRALHAVSPSALRYHTWHAFEAQYGSDDMGLENYLWYHGYLYEAARASYRTAGVDTLQQLWDGFVVATAENMTDAELVRVLQHVQPELARIVATLPE
jgi:hypothetical protein